jgi:hypothetical protein
MSVTRISDVIVPEVFTPYMIERTAELSALWQSGIVDPNPEFTSLAQGGGNDVNLPFWKDLTGDSESDDDDPSNPANPANIGSSSEVARKHFKRKAWGSADLAASLAGDDPMRAIADFVAEWWTRDMQRNALLPALTGIFAGPLASTHVLTKATEDANTAPDSAFIGSDNVIDCANLLGDHWERVTTLVMHSKPFSRLQKLKLIEYVPLSEQNIQVPFFLGRRVIVDDGCPAVNGSASGKKYTTYLFGAGTIAYGEGTPKVPTETDRDSLAGIDYLVTRRHFFLHPRGLKWVGAVAGKTPTNAELESGSSWSLVYEAKNVPILKLVTNG